MMKTKTPAADLKVAPVSARLIAECPHCKHDNPDFIHPEKAPVKSGVVGCWNCGRTFLVIAGLALDASVALTLALSREVAAAEPALVKSTPANLAVAAVRRAERRNQ